MKIAVIFCDATAAAHVPGADVERTVRTFDIPDDMARYIRSRNAYTTITFGLVDEKEPGSVQSTKEPT